MGGRHNTSSIEVRRDTIVSKSANLKIVNNEWEKQLKIMLQVHLKDVEIVHNGHTVVFVH